MNQIQSDIHVEGKFFSDHCFANLSSGQQPNYYHSSPAVSGFTDCFLISSSCQNKGHPWPVTQVIGVEDSPDSDSDYDSGVIRLYENVEKVFQHQPIRLFSPWLSPVRQPNGALAFQPIGALLIWAFSQYIDTNIFTSYTRMNDTSTSKAARTIGSHTRASINELTRSPSTNLRFGFLPTLPAAPLHAIEPWIVTAMSSSSSFSSRMEESHNEEKLLRLTKARNVWFITELIDYQCLDTDAITLSCIVASPFGRPVKEYRTVLGVLECLRDTIKALRSLYLDAKILDQDISDNNILISNAGNNNPDSPKGILIDFDNAIDMEIEPEKPYSLSEPRHSWPLTCRAAGDRALHTYGHDLESSFYVFLFMAVSGHGRASDECRVRKWEIV
ncbi:hypothetical protein FOXG_16529 [Fusarium oxysporum f. sp. lycopersici 4287]|uniref:Fungal-type protein kinase domain-containing protein n=2 Tax=Fusarium oxysporum TaxID=5507 RepID=A0A0J9W8G2_FUSO4|nr:hypothetical protein FOXG_16529 [Fusarium oxysporum f. sp. lycopersici 4287]KNB19088.1 hypothetical protein FOXG_16529 [Fusarium oxysporum f. sp. lycopersici 4287]